MRKASPPVLKMRPWSDGSNPKLGASTSKSALSCENSDPSGKGIPTRNWIPNEAMAEVDVAQIAALSSQSVGLGDLLACGQEIPAQTVAQFRGQVTQWGWPWFGWRR